MRKRLNAVLALVLAIAMMPISTLAAGVDFQLGTDSCDYYNLIEKKDYALAPGAVESEIIINSDAGTDRNVVHVMEVDLTNPNISVMPSYYNISETVDYTNEANWKTTRMSDQVKHAEQNLGLNVVGAMNVCLSWAFEHPYGLLIYNGKVLYDDRANSPGKGYLAITKDGKAELRDAMAELTGDEWMAQTVCFDFLVRDGVNKAENEDHTSAGAPRSVIGIKANGNLVLMMNDGRQAPYSKGFTTHEMAETMIALGCVDAINCDGGGSSTFITERAGSGEATIKSKSSDGVERETITGILVVSNAVSDGVFTSATLTADNTSVTAGTSVNVKAVGSDAAGGPAEIPADAVWQVADETYGSVDANGVFTAGNVAGDAEVQLVYGGEVVGSVKISVVAPNRLAFEESAIPVTSVRATGGDATFLPLVGYYNNTPIALNENDVTLSTGDAADGEFHGLFFVPNAEYSGGKEVTVTATLNSDPTQTATVKVLVFSKYEVEFDFANADGSNYYETTETKKGPCPQNCTSYKWFKSCSHQPTYEVVVPHPASVAWDRYISDTDEDVPTATYTVKKNPEENPFEVSYTFGVDATQIPLPNGAGSALAMVDSEGSYNNAWEAACSLAPRITTDTVIKVVASLDPSIKVDTSGAFIVSDFFKLGEITNDGNNNFTFNIHWIAQPVAVDFATEDPIIILSGIKGTVEGLEANKTYTYDLTGTANYKICILTSTGYSNANIIGALMKGVEKYEKSPGAESGQNASQGISMTQNNVLSFEDSFNLVTTWLHNVWKDNKYYRDNAPVTGIQQLPDMNGTDTEYFYNCAEDGTATIYTGWYETESGKMYAENGILVAGEKVIDGNNYFFGADGYARKGAQLLSDGNYWYFNDEYIRTGLYTGFVNTDNGMRYANAGKITSGYAKIEGKSYYFDENGYAFNGEYVLCGETCIFENGLFKSSTTADLMDAGLAGATAEYVIYADGTFLLGGSGETYRFDNHGTRPFIDYTYKINEVKIGEDITKINQSFFAWTSARTVEFLGESKLAALGTMAFYETYIKTIVIPDSLTYMSTSAFGMREANKSGIVNVILPPTANNISSSAFYNCSYATLYVIEGSYAHQYAVQNNLKYKFYNRDEVIVHETRDSIDGTVSFDMTIPQDIPETAKVIVAGYDAENGFCDMAEKSASETSKLRISADGVSNYKVFIWDDLGTMLPHTDVLNGALK